MLALLYCQKEISISFYFDIKHNLYSYKGESNMYTYEHKVQYYETDKMGITHHSNYIRWMDAFACSGSSGEGRAFAIRHSIQHLAQSFSMRPYSIYRSHAKPKHTFTISTDIPMHPGFRYDIP